MHSKAFHANRLTSPSSPKSPVSPRAAHADLCPTLQEKDEAYLEQCGIPELFDRLAKELVERRPEDHMAYLSKRMEVLMSSKTPCSSGTAMEDCPPGIRRNERSVSQGLSESLERKRANALPHEKERQGSSSSDDKVYDLAVFPTVKELMNEKNTLKRSAHRSVTSITHIGVQKRALGFEGETKEPFGSPRNPRVNKVSISAELRPSPVQQLMETVRQLSPTEQAAALVFVEGLLDKNVKQISDSVLGFMEGTLPGESPGETTSDNHIHSSAGPQSELGNPFFTETPLNLGLPAEGTAHLQELVRDALTASIVARIGDGGTIIGNDCPLPLPNLTKSVPCNNFLSPPDELHVNMHSSEISSEAPHMTPTTGTTKTLDDMSRNSQVESGFARVECSTPLTPPEIREDELDVLRDAVRDYEIFFGLSKTQREVFIRKMERCSFTMGQEFLCEKGNLPWRLLFVFSGSISLEHNGQVRRQFSSGEFLGRRELFIDPKLHEISLIRALRDDVVLYTLTHETFRLVLEKEHTQVCRLFLGYLLKSEALSVLASNDRRRIASNLRIHSYEPGSTIHQCGRPVEWLIIIMTGTVQLSPGNPEQTTHFTKTIPYTSPEVESLRRYSLSSNDAVDFPIDVTEGRALGDFELVFRTHALVQAVARTRVLVGRMHAVLFHTLLASNALERLRIPLALSPSYAGLRQLSPQPVREVIQRIRDAQKLPLFKLLSTSTPASSHLSSQRGSTCTGNAAVPQCTIIPTATATGGGGGGGGGGMGVGVGVASMKNRGACATKSRDRTIWQKVSSSGEIGFCGKRNLYRFPAAALAASNVIILAVVANGTIIRWNAEATRVTGYHQHNVIGQVIFSFLATDTARRMMREQLLNARRYAGNWDGYVAAGFSIPRAYRFRQTSALYDVNLIMSVVPSCLSTSSDVMLLVGREAESQAAASYAEDAVRWLDEVLRPQLHTFKRRMDSLEEKEWVILPEDGKRLRAHLETCNHLLENYLRQTSFSMDSMKESWKPVRIHNVLRTLVKEVAPTIIRGGHAFSSSIDEEIPLGEVFLDVERALGVLRRIVIGVSQTSTHTHIKIEVAVIRSTDIACRTHSSRDASSALDSSLPTTPPTARSQSATLSTLQTQSTMSTQQVNSNIVFLKDSVRLCSTSQHRLLIDGCSSPQRIRFSIISDAELWHESINSVSLPKVTDCPNTPTPSERKNTELQKLLQESERLLSGMGGSMTREPCDASPNTVGSIGIEFPLLPVPWGEDDADGAKLDDAPPSGRTLTIVVAERNAKHRNTLCRLMWARRHAVVPVTSYREVMTKIEAGDLDVLFIDPLHLEITEEESVALEKREAPFDALRGRPSHLVVVIHTDDFSDWRVQVLTEQCHVIELPKPAPEALLHVALHEAERVVASTREDEEQIALLRTAFSKFQRDRHNVGRLLGKGAFGDVYEVEDSLTGGKMAMKRMCLKDGVLADDVLQELLAMTSLRHENIIHYFYCEKEGDTMLRLYMELASGGTLQDKIRRHGGPLPHDEIVRHLQDLVRGLAYVHSQNYVHGDIKTANALIDHHGRTKIGDFGTAKRLKKPTDELFTMAGSAYFMAPEVINVDPEKGFGYNQMADIWSLGCVAMELATGMSPFTHLECAHGMGIIFYVSKLTDVPDLRPLEGGDALIYDFVRRCLFVDPTKRSTALELLHHPIFQTTESHERQELLLRRAEMLHTLDYYAAIDRTTARAGVGSDTDEEDEEPSETEERGSFGSYERGGDRSTCVGFMAMEGRGNKSRASIEEMRLTMLASKTNFFSSSNSTYGDVEAGDGGGSKRGSSAFHEGK